MTWCARNASGHRWCGIAQALVVLLATVASGSPASHSCPHYLKQCRGAFLETVN